MTAPTSITPAASEHAAGHGLAPRVFNFSAGPAAIPEEVLREVREDVWSIDGTGVGVLEHSHRGAVIDRVLEEAIDDFRTVTGLGPTHEVLFLSGGATMQFATVPLNALPTDGVADYLDTGVWARKATADAARVGRVNVAFDGGPHYTRVPGAEDLRRSDRAAYLYYCSNNTVFGTRFPTAPTTDAPLVCDATSDLLAQPIDLNAHAITIASGQKNIGASGISVMTVDRAFLESARGPMGDSLPSMLDIRAHIGAGSRLNTPPTFGLYLIGRMLKWTIRHGGIEAMAARTRAGTDALYATIDGSGGFYTGLADVASRSPINVAFRTPTPELDDRFAREATANGLDGTRGHRAAGGLRASIYNGCPVDAAPALVSFMHDFAQRAG